MLNEKKLVRGEDLFELLEKRDEIIKHKIKEAHQYADSVRKVCYDEIKRLKSRIESLKEKIRKIEEKQKKELYYSEIESEYQYKIELPEEEIVYYFETEKVAEEFFKNEVQYEKSFKANRKMWDLIYKIGKNDENLELAEDKIDDK